MTVKLFLTLAILLFLSASICPAQTFNIPEGTTPVMDGSVSAAEWSDADSVTINISANISCTVLFKHDCNSLYLTYLDNLESMAALFPEVLLDVNNSKSTSWETDDWWFHVSATDCHYQGAYAVYSNCLVTQSSWTGIPNFVSGPPNTDTVEIKIPFATVNISLLQTIGIAFVLTNTASVWHLWPLTATTASPATWGTATLTCSSIDINENPAEDSFSIYHSPSANEIIIDSKKENNIYSIDIIDLTGRVIESIKPGKRPHIAVDASAIQNGIVLVKLTTADKKEIVKKVQIIH
jgi:hypothetical protein